MVGSFPCCTATEATQCSEEVHPSQAQATLQCLALALERRASHLPGYARVIKPAKLTAGVQRATRGWPHAPGDWIAQFTLQTSTVTMHSPNAPFVDESGGTGRQLDALIACHR